MAIEHKYPVTNYSVTLMKKGFGWIQLKDGEKDAGYIYFTDENGQSDRFGAVNSDHPYIVTHQPIHLWSTFLDILRNEKPLYIRGYQNDANSEVSAFFGTSTDEPSGEGEL
jgi:hypothetical protein